MLYKFYKLLDLTYSYEKYFTPFKEFDDMINKSFFFSPFTMCPLPKFSFYKMQLMNICVFPTFNLISMSKTVVPLELLNSIFNLFVG